MTNTDTVVEEVQTKWGPWNRHALKLLKDGYKTARRDSVPIFDLQGQAVITDFAKYLIQYLEGEGLTPCDCH